MNYQAHYDRLITRARNRALDGYVERHHVIPRCLGGDSSPGNLVRLTAREHYVAHLLLMKANPGNRCLVHAAWTMSRKSRFVAGRVGGRTYAWLRTAFAVMMRAKMSGATLSAETRAKMSEAAKQNNIPADQRQRMVAASATTRSSKEFRERIAAEMREKWKCPQFRAVKRASMNRSSPRRSAAMVERWGNGEYRARMTTKLAGVNRGRKASPETRAKMSAAHKGKTIPPAQREKMRQAALAWRRAKRESSAAV